MRKYGWKKDRVDHRDHIFMARRREADTPDSDLRALCPLVYDQGDLGSCTANAIAGAVEFEQRKQQLPDACTPSRLFVYYNEREMENSVDEDSGASLRDGIKSIASLGVCPEPEWPYVIGQYRTKPPQSCYDHALKHQALEYARVSQGIEPLRACLADGFPIVFGFTVYRSFESPEVARNGMVSMPGFFEKPVGGHAVVLVGSLRVTKQFIVRNSYGEAWGKAGYFFMPFDYVCNIRMASDFWTIRLVERGDEGETNGA